MILILSGVPGSGKTHRAKEWVAEDPSNRLRINYDDLRAEMFGRDWRFNKVQEAEMKAKAVRIARDCLFARVDIVIDNTNLTPSARQPWIDLGKQFGVEVIQEDIDTPVSVCIERDRVRPPGVGGRVGRAVIERMALFNGWLDLKEGYNPSQFVIVDVDGTLADNKHRQAFLTQTKMVCPKGHNPLAVTSNGMCLSCGSAPISKPDKDWKQFHERVHLDTPHAPIWRLLRILAYHYSILVVSGRSPEGGCAIATEDWLDTNWNLYGPPEHHYKHLFMRAPLDYREDSIIKQEILDLLPKERIAFVLDDRDRVVDMWRRNGLTCLQVAKGDF